MKQVCIFNIKSEFLESGLYLSNFMAQHFLLPGNTHPTIGLAIP